MQQFTLRATFCSQPLLYLCIRNLNLLVGVGALGCVCVGVGVGNAQSFSAHSSKQRAARFDANRKREAAAPVQQMGATLNN